MLRTPLRRSDWLSKAARADVWLKLETLQPTFSYKIRGAFNAVLRLIEQVDSRRADASGSASAPSAVSPVTPRGVPVVTASAGNHGRALAHAARGAGLELIVYVPEHAPRVKLEAIRHLGAEVRTCADYDEAERRAKEHGASGAALFISPYSHPDVIAGAGTVGLEILEEQPDTDTIIVSIGGGGLVSGIAIAASATGTCGVSGVEVEASSPFTHGLAAGRVVPIDVRPTLADGLAGNLDPDTITFDLVRELVREIAVVTEADLRTAISGVAHQEKLIVEGAGAAGIASLVAQRIDVRDKKVAVVLSGANIDPETLRAII